MNDGETQARIFAAITRQPPIRARSVTIGQEVRAMLDDSDDEPTTNGWLVAVTLVLASLVFGSFVAWVVGRAGG